MHNPHTRIDPENGETVCIDCDSVPQDCDCPHGCCPNCDGTGIVTWYQGDEGFHDPCDECRRGHDIEADPELLGRLRRVF